MALVVASARSYILGLQQQAYVYFQDRLGQLGPADRGALTQELAALLRTMQEGGQPNANAAGGSAAAEAQLLTARSEPAPAARARRRAPQACLSRRRRRS